MTNTLGRLVKELALGQRFTGALMVPNVVILSNSGEETNLTMIEYRYKCNKCNNYFEVVRPMSESDKEAECPKCESLDTFKVIQASSVFFNCGGFYSGKPLV